MTLNPHRGSPRRSHAWRVHEPYQPSAQQVPQHHAHMGQPTRRYGATRQYCPVSLSNGMLVPDASDAAVKYRNKWHHISPINPHARDEFSTSPEKYVNLTRPPARPRFLGQVQGQVLQDERRQARSHAWRP